MLISTFRNRQFLEPLCSIVNMQTETNTESAGTVDAGLTRTEMAMSFRAKARHSIHRGLVLSLGPCGFEGCENKKMASSSYCSNHARALDIVDDSKKPSTKSLTSMEVLKCIEPCLQHLLRMVDAKDTVADTYVDQLQAMAEEALDHCGAPLLGGRKRVKHAGDDESIKKSTATNALALDDKGAVAVEWTLAEVESGVDTFLDGILQGCLSMFEKTAGSGPDALWRPVPDEFSYKNPGAMAVWEATLLDTTQTESEKLATLCVTVARDFSRKVANVGPGRVESQPNSPDQKTDLPLHINEEEANFFQFEPALPPDPGRENKGCIVDIKVLMHKRLDKVPLGYEVLRQSLDGQGANLNKSSGKHVYLCFRRGSAHEPGFSPITAVTVLFTCEEINEYAPFGFTALEDSLTPGYPANLSSNTFPIFLAVRRGQGAPLSDVSIVFRERSASPIPAGFHEVMRTPSGHEADTNSHTSGIPCFVCVRPDITSALRPFHEYVKRSRDRDGKALCREEGFAQTLATLIAALHCYRRDLPKAVFDAFRLLPVAEVPDELLNLFVSGVCGVLPTFWGWAAPELRTNSLAFLLMLLEDNLHAISATAMLQVLSVFAFTQQSKEAGQSTGHKLVGSMAMLLSRLQPRSNTNADSTCKKSVGLLSQLATKVANTKRLAPLENAFFSSKAGSDALVAEIASVLDVVSSKPIEFDSSTFRVPDSKPDYSRMESLVPKNNSLTTDKELAQEIAEQERKALENERLTSVQQAKERAVQGEEIATKHQDLYELRRKPMLFMAVPRGEALSRQHVVIKINLVENFISFHVVDGKKGDSIQVIHFPREGLKSIKKVDLKGLMFEFSKPREFKKEYNFQASEFRDGLFDLVTKHMSNQTPLAARSPRMTRVTHSSSILSKKPSLKDEEQQPSDTSLPPGKDLFLALNLSWIRTAKLLQGIMELGLQNSADIIIPDPTASMVFDLGEAPLKDTLQPKNSSHSNLYKSPSLKVIEADDIPGQIELERKLLAMFMFACKLSLYPDISTSIMHSIGRQNGKIAYAGARLRNYGCSLLSHALNCASFISVSNPRPSFDSSVHEALPLPHAFTTIVRNFVCPTLVHCSISSVDSVMLPTLQSVEVLWRKYQKVCPVQNGILMQHFCVDILRSPYIHPLHKIGVLEMLNNTVFVSFKNAMNIFLNYDNQDGKLSEGFDVYKHIIKTVCEVATSSGREMYHRKNIQLPVDSKSTEKEPIDALRIRCFGLLADYLERSAIWIKNNVPKCGPDKLTQITGRLARGVTWVARYRARKDKDMIFKLAVEVYKKTKKIKAAMTMIKDNLPYLDVGYDEKLGSSDMIFPRVVAQFLRICSKSLDKAVIGDTLSMWDDHFMHNKQWLEIRRAFLAEMDFTHMTFDESLRYYLIEGGFRLPGEAQKIDRLLEVFCQRYCTCNPGVFKSSSPAFILAFAMIMLNTDIHDVRLGKGAKREKMTVNQFCSNLRGTNDKEDFPRAQLEEAYMSIANEEIAWKEAQVDTPLPLSADASAEPEDEAKREEQLSLKKRQAREEKEKERKQSLAKMVRNTKMRLHQRVYMDRTWTETSQDMHTGLSLAMWDLTWQPIFNTLSHAEKITGTETDIAILNSCLRATKSMKEIFQQLEAEGARFKAFEELANKLAFRVKHVTLRRDIEASSLVKDYRYHFKKYPNCLCASELIDWIVLHLKIDPVEAIEAGRNLAHVGLCCIVGDAKEREISFREDKRLYEFKPIIEAWGGGGEIDEDDLDDIDEAKDNIIVASPDISVLNTISVESTVQIEPIKVPPPPPPSAISVSPSVPSSPTSSSAPSSPRMPLSPSSLSLAPQSNLFGPRKSKTNFGGWGSRTPKKEEQTSTSSQSGLEALSAPAVAKKARTPKLTSGSAKEQPSREEYHYSIYEFV